MTVYKRGHPLGSLDHLNTEIGSWSPRAKGSPRLARSAPVSRLPSVGPLAYRYTKPSFVALATLARRALLAISSPLLIGRHSRPRCYRNHFKLLQSTCEDFALVHRTAQCASQALCAQNLCLPRSRSSVDLGSTHVTICDRNRVRFRRRAQLSARATRSHLSRLSSRSRVDWCSAPHPNSIQFFPGPSVATQVLLASAESLGRDHVG